MENAKPVLHILVVGFHHKKGCQVEFSYPPLVAGTEGKSECPSGWKYLPTLALPDGSHNFNSDFVSFNLPSLTDPQQSVYGISCYRQIALEDVKIRTADLTRSTVQKSVCTLLSLPIYGYIEVKLSLIAQAFFEQGDFSTTDILVKAYDQLNAVLTSPERQTMLPPQLYFIGIPLRELLLKWRHKILILFKLLLLQKRVVCFGSPVHPTGALILGIASLQPELISKGFQQVACVKTSRPMSPMPTFDSPNEEEPVRAGVAHVSQAVAVPKINLGHNSGSTYRAKPDESDSAKEGTVADREELESVAFGGRSIASAHEANADETPSTTSSSPASSATPSESVEPDGLLDAGNNLAGMRAGGAIMRETSVDTIASNFSSLCAIEPTEWGAPLRIFHEGNLCLPYISLPYMDLLSDPAVKGYIVGASNVLFQHKRQLADVMIDVEAAIIDVLDLETKREIQLSTEDLRFADFIVRHVQMPKEGAEGSEAWIRDQLYGYTVALLKTSLIPNGSKEIDHFNAQFMAAFKTTRCYQDWYERTGGGAVPAFDGLAGGHPFAGTLSVADMRLRLAQTMQNSESGRKLNQVVENTSRAVGDALTTAKGAFSSWWTSISSAPPAAANSSQTADNLLVAGLHVAEDAHFDDDSDDSDEMAAVEQKEASARSYRARDSPSKRVIPTAEIVSQSSSNSVIEIGKEAELLDRRSSAVGASANPATNAGIP
ncbi:AGAP000251-PA-like protein [Anopheles sinensis]|uniref:AGAP000251-PA-like protein n=1 Tax=Anopheles sinensis TaxID=74873 RepID=A0A084VH11_ANOSI|nr:AGAP000251-PA-like protein [Anopheles sinensis]